MSISQTLLQEMEHEAKTTRRLLEVVPEDKLAWKPHEKSMSLGKLASHIAENPGWGPYMAGTSELDFASNPDEFKPFEAADGAALLAKFDAGVEGYKKALDGRDDAFMMEPWTMRNGEHVYFTLPRVVAFKTWTLSHMIHHRGQLSVYLRLLDVPLPDIYGPSADSKQAS